MKGTHLGAFVTILGLATVVGCSGRGTEAPATAAKEEPAPVAAAPARPDTDPSSAASEEPQPDTAVKAASEAAGSERVKDVPSPAPAEPAAAPAEAPAPVTPAKPVPAGRVEVGATKAGLTRIGADKCKLCHKTQYESWAATAHAGADPPLDCESCHGPGSEYKTMAIMKDPAKARAAGLVMPEASFCTSSCHDTGWSADMLTKAHAHKKG